MPRDSKEIRDLKLKAIREAIEILKEETTPTTNYVIVTKVLDLANELIINKSSTQISPTSLKSPVGSEFKELKKEINKYEEAHEKIKALIPKKSLKEVTKQKKQIDNLLFEIAKYYDDKLLLNEELELKDRTINKLKEERDDYYERIKVLKK